MLVDERVALRVPDELDVVLKLFATPNARVERSHALGILHGARPEEDREGFAHGIFARRHAGVDPVGVAFAGARVRARDAHLTREKRHHGDGRRLRFAVHAPLRAPALRNEDGFHGCNFPRQAFDRLDGHLRDARGPKRRLRSLVGPVAENVGLVVGTLRGRLRQGLLVVAHAVLVEERLIDQVFVDHDPGHAFAERRIGARTNGNPLGIAPGQRVGADRIDHDHAGLAFAKSSVELPGLAAARSARDRRVVPERDVELRVLHLIHV